MNKRKTLLLSLGAVGAAALILLAVALWRPSPAVQWPAFAPANEPQVMVVVDPDFGHHIGDVVPVDIFVRQPHGTKVDVGSMALEGDFEVRNEPEVTRAVRGDAEYIRIRLYLQSFAAFKPAYEAKISMVYEVPGDRNVHEVKAPTVKVGTSNTWDGRDEIKEGQLAPWYGSHLLWTIGYLVAGVLGFIGSWIAVRRIRKGMPKPSQPKTPLSPRQKGKILFDRVWKKIRAGDQSERNFRQIDVIVRKLERIENVLLEHVPVAVGDNHPRKAQIVHILQQCERVIFQGVKLSEDELDVLEATFYIFIGAVPKVKTDTKAS